MSVSADEWAGAGERYSVLVYQVVDEVERLLVFESADENVIRAVGQAFEEQMAGNLKDASLYEGGFDIVLWQRGEPGTAILTLHEGYAAACVFAAIRDRMAKVLAWFEPIVRSQDGAPPST